MWKTHDMKRCCFCGLWRHLGIELLSANPVHARTAKGRAVDRTPAAYRELALIPHLAEEK